MIIFSNCKINLGLRIVSKRADGYHELETVFYPIPFNDIIEVVRTIEAGTKFTSTGLTVDGPPDQNLCLKAYMLLKRVFDLPPVNLHLHKTVPQGAGLGGGSANAAFTLKLLNTKFNLGLHTKQLLDLALQLGSDCPFFIVNQPCIATGRGELMEAIDLSRLGGYTVVLVNPGIQVSTAWAFSRISVNDKGSSIKDIISKPVSEWKHELTNDLETVVFDAHPEVRAIKETLYSKGAVYAAMSGSGSTVYGLFEEQPDINFDGYMTRVIKLD